MPAKKTIPKATDSHPRLVRVLPFLLIVGGVIGIICSMVLIGDQIHIWENPGFVPSCSLNPIVNCGTVINSKQGDIFDIPAPFFGLLVFPAVVTVGVVMLAGARFARWFWKLFALGMLGGVAFALWLFWLSLYVVHALCPFCLTVDVVMYTLAWYTTLYVIREGHIAVPARLIGVVDFARRYHLEILVSWFVIVIVIILHHFWYYFGQFI